MSDTGAVTIACVSSCLGITPMSQTSLDRALAHEPDALVADGGTADVGAQYLGTGVHLAPRAWEEHDLRLLLRAALARRIPLIVGSVGGAGTDAAVEAYLAIVRRIAAEEQLPPFRLAGVYSELDRDWLAERARTTTVAGLGYRDPLTAETVTRSARVVAMAGIEPIVACLADGADVVIAGRSCDVALFAALPVLRGVPTGIAVHLGKTIECGSLAAEPVISREPVIGVARHDDFLVRSCHPDQRCTPASVASFQLYERSDPLRELLPGGYADLSSASFVADSDDTCRVSGSRWVAADAYEMKLEGAEYVGHRAYVIFGVRDRGSTANIDGIIEQLRARVAVQFPELAAEGGHIAFHVYGRDAILGVRETAGRVAHELGVVVDMVHPDRERLVHIGSLVKYLAFRADYPGKHSSGGTGALLAEEVLEAPKPVYRWSIDHLLTVAHWSEVIATSSEDVADGTSTRHHRTARIWEDGR